MPFTIVVLLALFIAVVVVSFARIAAVGHARVRVLLFGLRSALLALIAIAFIEPAVVFDKISSPVRPVPVFVDVSKSMRLFAGSDTLLRALSSLELWNAGHASDKQQRFVFCCFGDSLRPFNDKTAPLFSDRRSFLPAFPGDRIARQSTALLLISDGNWSNASLPADYFSDKTVYYLPLQGLRRYPYIQMAVRDFPETSPLDSPLVANLALEGVSRHGDTIAVSIMEKNRVIARKAVPVAAGYFRHDVSFRLSSRIPGRHLYRFDARSTVDSLDLSRYALTTVLPGRFGYALHASGISTLDRRFIQLALKRHPDFIELPADTNQKADMLILFDWNDEARKKVNRVKSAGGLLLFLGTLPCAEGLSAVQGSVVNALVRPVSSTPMGSFHGFDFSRLPPASRYISCTEMISRTSDVIIAALLPRNKTTGFDTLPVLFTGRFLNRNFIACAAADLWRWDFLPLAVEPSEEHAFAFSEELLLLTKEMLVNGLSEELLLCPAAPLQESDSLPFNVFFPADLAIPAALQVTCRFSNNNQPFDTVFMLSVVGSSRQTVRFRPLPAGNYKLEVSAAVLQTSNNRNRYAFSDSFTVDQDRSEYAITGQNSSLLQEIAQPLADFSPDSLRAAFFSRKTETVQPGKETLRLSRTWQLLALIFLFFAAEWIIRRKTKLD
jgi:hypothetical protein